SQYYGSCLESTCDLQTSAACSLPCRPMPKSAMEALNLVHPAVTKRLYILMSFVSRFFGCALPVPEKLQGCRILDLGSGSHRDCYALSKLVGEAGHVTGIDMTEELILASPGVENDSMDIIVSNCVVCLFPDKITVLREAYKVLKVSSPPHCEGMGGSLYWRDLISVVQEVSFSTPHLVSASHIEVHNCELKKKAGDISYASGTYRLFKLPKKLEMSSAIVTNKGTVSDYPCQLEFDSSHCFKTLQVDGELAVIFHIVAVIAPYSNVITIVTWYPKAVRECFIIIGNKATPQIPQLAFTQDHLSPELCPLLSLFSSVHSCWR
uniref:Arsenite methyltransferase n=1 Tax=Hucho hucho TaxID=62062 RepID=A0A4W5LL34_9TELE